MLPDISEWDEIPPSVKAAVPSHLFRALDDYVRAYIPTGGFLRAVLENDLFQAIRRADPQSRAALPAILELLLFAPATCFGSPEKVERWLAERHTGKGDADAHA